MKKILLTIGMVLVIVFLVAGIVATLKKPSDSNEPIQQPGTQFPAGGTTDISGDTFMVKTQSGSVVEVKNFLVSDTTIPDMENEGYFYLGNLFPVEETDNQPPYVITYIEDTQFFNVTLLSTPLYASQQQAELYLKSVLGISDSDMCNLQYTLSVPAYIDEAASGIDYRFSFCSDSTPIPQ